MNDPILILQMQRMGDLIMTFPLIVWLNRLHPDRQIIVVAEKTFYESMHQISPQAVYCPWESTGSLVSRRFSLVINLSHRDEAARLAGKVRAEEKLGAVTDESGECRILGDWRLYRASLVGFNRHNLFHWAEMNALDSVPHSLVSQTHWPRPRFLTPEERKVGVFIGASEEAKRPDAAFWAELVAELLHRDLRPVIFGGPAETEMGQEVVARFGGKVLNLCGKLSLNELVAVGQSLQLFITPDTGPMHLAAWSGLRVLNLSLGPVNPWETGPYNPGHFVLSPSLSCAGCWACTRPEISCRKALSPKRTAFLAAQIIRKKPEDVLRLRLPGQCLRLTGRGDEGLYSLEGPPSPSAREPLSRFWQGFFGWQFGIWERELPAARLEALSGTHPKLSAQLREGLPEFSRVLRKGLVGVLPSDFWKKQPPLIRPLSSYLNLLLENGSYSPAARKEALGLLERLIALRA